MSVFFAFLYVANGIHVPNSDEFNSGTLISLTHKSYYLGVKHHIPKGFSWSGAPEDFGEVHDQLKESTFSGEYFDLGKGKACYNETMRSLWIDFSTDLPQMSHAVKLDEINNLRTSHIFVKDFQQLAEKDNCTT
ncbi:hypothetical protein DSO57_1038509 [Entomophthora muscae]|uniref:Uncharacterized protein n=1 Tax=Entomophthora muscae TaxID=34485 RepID=A0ACC2UJP1_9FUNG|nr:hypothetical protein DSO57_1038509 [Entomophthora muscae]